MKSRMEGLALTHERLTELLAYDAERDVFRWRTSRRGVSAGQVAGCVRGDGYRVIGIDGHPYLAHRVAWFYVHGEWPHANLDHADLSRSSARLDGLRPATKSQNAANSPLGRNNTSGAKGVTWERRRQKWKAQIKVNYRNIFLGEFASKDDARAAYAAAAQKYFGEYARAA
jgi:hypothetical protein